MHLKALQPVVVNLAGAGKAWMRLEGAIVIEGEPGKDADLLAAQISEDVVAFLRTVTLEHVAGPNGFHNLKEDLEERARVRANGKVKAFLIQGLVIE